MYTTQALTLRRWYRTCMHEGMRIHPKIQESMLPHACCCEPRSHIILSSKDEERSATGCSQTPCDALLTQINIPTASLSGHVLHKTTELRNDGDRYMSLNVVRAADPLSTCMFRVGFQCTPCELASSWRLDVWTTDLLQTINSTRASLHAVLQSGAVLQSSTVNV